MADKQRPGLTERAAADLAARREREAAALRANLRRRKAQRDEPGVDSQAGAGSQPGDEEASEERLPRRGPMR